MPNIKVKGYLVQKLLFGHTNTQTHTHTLVMVVCCHPVHHSHCETVLHTLPHSLSS